MKHEETARRLLKAMSNALLNASDLSKWSGVSEASISQYVNGRNKPGAANAQKLADILCVNPEWLMGHNVPEKTEEMMRYEDQLVLDAYHKLTDEQKDLVNRMLGI